MNESSVSDNESCYRNEYLRRKNRLAEGRVKGYYRYFDHSENSPPETIQEFDSLNNSVTDEKTLKSNASLNFSNEFVGDPGVADASSAMVGYYNNFVPSTAHDQSSTTTARINGKQNPTIDVTPCSDLLQSKRISGQLADSTTSLLSSSSFRVSKNSAFTPVLRATSVERFDAPSSTRAAAPPHAFVTVPSATLKPPQISIVLRNKDGQDLSQAVHTYLTEQSDNNNNNQKISDSTTMRGYYSKKNENYHSTLNDDRQYRRNDYPEYCNPPSSHVDNNNNNNNGSSGMAISRFARKDIFSPDSKNFYVKLNNGGANSNNQLNGPRLLQQANSTIAAAMRKEENLNNSMSLPSVMRSAMKYQPPPAQHQQHGNGVAVAIGNHHNQKLPFPVLDNRVQQESIATKSFPANSSFFEQQQQQQQQEPQMQHNRQTFPKRLKAKSFDNYVNNHYNHHGDNRNGLSEEIIPEETVDNLSRWQAEQKTYRKVHKPQLQRQTIGLFPDNKNLIALDKVESYTNIADNLHAFIPPMQTNNNVINNNNTSRDKHHLQQNGNNNGIVSATKDTFQLTPVEQNEQQTRVRNNYQTASNQLLPSTVPVVQEQQSEYVEPEYENLQTSEGDNSDVLKAGNVGAKTKLFENLAQHVKHEADEQNAYKAPVRGRRKMERSKTIHTEYRRPLSPIDNKAEPSPLYQPFDQPISSDEAIAVAKISHATLPVEAENHGTINGKANANVSVMPTVQIQMLPVEKRQCNDEVSTIIRIHHQQQRQQSSPGEENSSFDDSDNRSPLPGSSELENFEDDKSKLTLSEKAKFFEIKSQEAKNRNRRFQQRHKTQPVTQVHRIKSKSEQLEEVVKARNILLQMSQDENNHEISAPNQDKSATSGGQTKKSNPKAYSAKPRRTVYLHMENGGSGKNNNDIENVAPPNDALSNGNLNSKQTNVEISSLFQNRLIIEIKDEDSNTNNEIDYFTNANARTNRWSRVNMNSDKDCDNTKISELLYTDKMPIMRNGSYGTYGPSKSSHFHNFRQSFKNLRETEL